MIGSIDTWLSWPAYKAHTPSEGFLLLKQYFGDYLRQDVMFLVALWVFLDCSESSFKINWYLRHPLKLFPVIADIINMTHSQMTSDCVIHIDLVKVTDAQCS